MDCTSLLYPSISEGGAASVLVVLAAGGLVPIITRTCGLDLEPFSIIMEDSTFESIDLAISKYLETPVDDHLTLCNNIMSHVREHYKESQFEQNITKIIKSVL